MATCLGGSNGPLEEELNPEIYSKPFHLTLAGLEEKIRIETLIKITENDIKIIICVFVIEQQLT